MNTINQILYCFDENWVVEFFRDGYNWSAVIDNKVNEWSYLHVIENRTPDLKDAQCLLKDIARNWGNPTSCQK